MFNVTLQCNFASPRITMMRSRFLRSIRNIIVEIQIILLSLCVEY